MNGEAVHCKVTEIPIHLYEFGKYPLYLVAVFGFGKDPMYLITNCRGKEESFCKAIVKMYLLRWRIEDHFRFKKQQYHFEDFRVRSLRAIRTLHQLVTLLTGYLALLSQEPNTVITRVLREAAQAVPRYKKRKAKKIFHYELAAGFAKLLRRTSANLNALFPPLRPRHQSPQLSLFPIKHRCRFMTA